MSDQPNLPTPPTDDPDPILEQRLRDAGRAFDYPPTPDIAATVRSRLTKSPRPLPSRRLLWAALIIAILLAGLMAVPEVRAAVLKFLRIGSVTIFQSEPTPTTTPTGAFAPAPTPTLIFALQRLSGKVTLTEARQQFGYPIKFPTYPTDLGEPDAAFLQYFGDKFLLLAWQDRVRTNAVRMTLHILAPQVDVNKLQPKVITRTTVNGNPAVWAQGPYIVQIQLGGGSDIVVRQLVSGHMLIWADGELTYRLETALSIEETVKIAESLR
jgi:hypothetical protein